MNDTAKDMVVGMIDKRIGKRIKQCRERLGLTQEEFAEKTGFTANYISTLERGASFPRCENLILLLNALEVSADAIFCDVLDHTTEYKATQLSPFPIKQKAESTQALQQPEIPRNCPENW